MARYEVQQKAALKKYEEVETSIAKFSGNLDCYFEESKDLHERHMQQLKAAKQRAMTSKYIDKMIKNEKKWIIQSMKDVKD